MLLQVQLKLETSLPPYSPLACDCPSGYPYVFPAYAYFLESQGVLREDRVLPNKPSAGPQEKSVHNGITQYQLFILSSTTSLPSGRLENEDTDGERGYQCGGKWRNGPEQ